MRSESNASGPVWSKGRLAEERRRRQARKLASSRSCPAPAGHPPCPSDPPAMVPGSDPGRQE